MAEAVSESGNPIGVCEGQEEEASSLRTPKRSLFQTLGHNHKYRKCCNDLWSQAGECGFNGL